MESNRHLAAIMFTDIIGYTRMMNENEAAAYEVRQRHRQIFEKEHVQHNGKVIQYYGDGTLSTFKSAVEAVRCAIQMQQSFQVDIKVPLRIGIHLGDIVFSDREVYGDGVNLASRIESLGIEGAVLLSGTIKKAIQGHPSIELAALGQFEFKNILDPVEVFCVANKGLKIPEQKELKSKSKGKGKSIAVLPFVNMSPDPDNEYFSDGITEEILNALVKVEGLHVTARTSSFAFKGKNIDIREIGHKLGVDHILEGSVRKSGNRVRITAQLISSVDGYHYFSETYDRQLEDIFAVQDEISLKITNRLRKHLGESEHLTSMVTAPTLNMKAYELYLQGLYYFNQWGQVMGKAIPYFEKSLKLENDFLLAHARLGICYYFQGFAGVMSWREARDKASYHFSQCTADRADSPEVYFAIFVYHVFIKWDWRSAWEVTKAGLKKFPNFASLYHSLSTLYWIKGDLPNVLQAHHRGLSLDPLSIEMNLYMGVAYIWDGNLEKATHYIDKVLDMIPQHRAAREYMGWIAAFTGQYDAAQDIFEKLEPIGYRLHQSTCLGWIYHKQGQFDKAKNNLEKLIELESASQQGIGFTVDIAVLCTCMGDFDLAFQYLEKAIQNRVGSIMMCTVDPFLLPLKSDPRFKHIEKLIGEVPEIDYSIN